MVTSSVRGMDQSGGQLSESLALVRDAVSALQSEDLHGVDSGSLLTDVADMRRLVDQVEGEWLRRVGEVHGRGAAQVVGAGSTKAFLRGTCLVSPAEASKAVDTATALRTTCAATAEAVAGGVVGIGQAQVIAKVITDLPSALPEDTRLDGERVLLEHAAALNPAELARAGRYFASRVDPHGVARDEAEQRERSGITFASTLYGAGIARGDLDPESLAVICAAIEPLSGPQPGADGVDRRTPARRRLDAVVEVMRHHLDCQQPPDVRRPGAHLTVVTGAGTLKGEPGGSSLDWGGVVSGETTRRLACDASVTPVTVGPLGQVLDVGRRTRTVNAPIWAALVVRDRHCAFPGCDTPAGRCDAHHITHWADGGPTSLTNLVMLCRYHHQRVLHDEDHEDRWTVRVDDDTGRPVFTPPVWTGRRGVRLPPLWQPDDGRPPDG